MATTFFTLLLFLFITHVAAQSPGTNFSCHAASASPCDAYISYTAHIPSFMSVGNISDLFGVSRDLIVESSNLESEETELVPGQLLLVPIKCGCNGTRYFSNITYEIKNGDNYYGVSIGPFENLTNWHVVEDTNPSLVPTQLKPGTKVIFPLFCKCPSVDDLDGGINYFITYVWQLGDQVTAVANKFNSTEPDIITRNNPIVLAQPVLIPVPRLPVLSQPIPPNKHGSTSYHKLAILIIIIVLASVVSVLLLLLVIYCYYVYGSGRVQKGKKKSLDRNGLSLETSASEKLEKVIPGISGYLGKPMVFDTETIMEATMNLDDSFKVGRSVYKAVIEGQILAVKRIKDENDEELRILQRVNHSNLVQLVGFSWNKTTHNLNNSCCFLVSEYVENGSLTKWSTLTWSQRLKIALDVANGLQYLHEHAQPSIVHGDIRTKNILLDSNYKAKISNFSMARHAVGPAELKSDVFGFGVVVLELLSGKKDVGGIMEGEEGREERLRKWMDPNLEGFFPTEGALSLVGLANACVSEKADSRPSMGEVVFNLSVLMHSCSEVSDKSWTSGMEMEEVVQIIRPIKAR